MCKCVLLTLLVDHLSPKGWLIRGTEPETESNRQETNSQFGASVRAQWARTCPNLRYIPDIPSDIPAVYWNFVGQVTHLGFVGHMRNQQSSSKGGVWGWGGSHKPDGFYWRALDPRVRIQ